MTGDSKAIHRTRAGEAVRVFDASGSANAQETATVLRSVAIGARVFALDSRKKISFRGAAEDVALAEWMMSRDVAKKDFQLGAVRQFRLGFPASVQELQEAATVVRSIGEIQRLIVDNETKSVFVRGSQEQIDLADWIFKQLASAPIEAATRESKYGGEVVKVYFLKRDAATVHQLQETAVKVRRDTQIRRMFTYNASRAIFVRCTAEQAAQADALLK